MFLHIYAHSVQFKLGLLKIMKPNRFVARIANFIMIQAKPDIALTPFEIIVSQIKFCKQLSSIIHQVHREKTLRHQRNSAVHIRVYDSFQRNLNCIGMFHHTSCAREHFTQYDLPLQHRQLTLSFFQRSGLLIPVVEKKKEDNGMGIVESTIRIHCKNNNSTTSTKRPLTLEDLYSCGILPSLVLCCTCESCNHSFVSLVATWSERVIWGRLHST